MIRISHGQDHESQPKMSPYSPEKLATVAESSKHTLEQSGDQKK